MAEIIFRAKVFFIDILKTFIFILQNSNKQF